MSFLPSVLQLFKAKADNFCAGQIAKCFSAWQSITSDSEVLQTVSGEHIDFSSHPTTSCATGANVVKPGDNKIFLLEISKLLKKGVILPSAHEDVEFISPIFLRAKKDGTHRLILNLKDFNKHVTYYHFKMDTIWTGINLMTTHCYMASVDLKDAYYSVPIAPSDQKFLKFEWSQQLYQYTCFPNGLAFCPRKFTKLLKPAYASLRQKGHISSAYIDDSWLSGNDYDSCVKNVIDTITLFDKLGFVIHPEKSVLNPTQVIEFLGFTLDSITMRVYLTSEKAEKLKLEASALFHCHRPSIRMVARVIGILISSFPGNQFGPLHYRFLEMSKTSALQCHHGNFDAHMTLSQEAKSELTWWISSIGNAFNYIGRGNAQFIIISDASKKGWGGVAGDRRTQGLWTEHEAAQHINFLEMLAVFFNLKSFENMITEKHVKVLVDNVAKLQGL